MAHLTSSKQGLWGKRSPLLSREVGMAVLRWGPRLSHYSGASYLLVEDEVENLCVVFEDWVSPVQTAYE